MIKDRVMASIIMEKNELENTSAYPVTGLSSPEWTWVEGGGTGRGKLCAVRGSTVQGVKQT